MNAKVAIYMQIDYQYLDNNKNRHQKRHFCYFILFLITYYFFFLIAKQKRYTNKMFT